MTDPFSIAIAFTLPEEHGYVDDPRDSGGATRDGVTQATYDIWRKEQGLETRQVGLITSAEEMSIYQWMYWEPGHCDSLPLPLAVAHFDWTVNHGVSGAAETLQKALGFASEQCDGKIGPATLAAVATWDPQRLASNYNQCRRRWYLDRVQEKPDQAAFLKGWLGRCERLDLYLAKLETPP